ncbi:CidA/LrgA family protein [Marinospirillum alkaliphilum]|uniref:Holin-like protein n=1 Tax=Marinospirillum alkaliphilum DSM 21637 TaxID=1122209 RepID=A0A1K1ZZH3_9GAMM|nr:CidA/LrgA family protein [Marinospirillum alkaliphilum]SFX79590.1 holin-like protein [Marinospirillum alkaliphilum DSM 21637]
MLAGFAALLLFQLIGELLVRLTGLPVPGPVLGMALLLAGVLLLKKVPESLRQASEGLLRYLPLLFVPAGVGLINHGLLLKQDLWVILITLVVSTALTLAVTVLVLQFLRKRWGMDDAGS